MTDAPALRLNVAVARQLPCVSQLVNGTVDVIGAAPMRALDFTSTVVPLGYTAGRDIDADHTRRRQRDVNRPAGSPGAARAPDCR